MGGLVRSQRGANAGWRLARSPEAISLLDVYNAVHDDPLFGLHASPPNPQCPIGRGRPSTLRKVYGTLEGELRRQLARTSVDTRSIARSTTANTEEPTPITSANVAAVIKKSPG